MSGFHDGITRRGALLGLAAATLLPAKSQALVDYPYPYPMKLGVMSGGPLKAVTLQGVTFNVPNLERGLDFYQSLYGLRIHNWQGKTPVLRIGEGPWFIKMTEATGRPNFECPVIGIKNFDAERVKKVLADLGVPSEIRYRTEANGGGGPGAPKGTPELFFKDPDGLEYQIQDETYAGGGGLKGDVVKLEPLTDRVKNAVFHAKTLNHTTNSYPDNVKTINFFYKIFDIDLMVIQGAGAFLGVGNHFLFGANKGRAAAIGHFALGMDNYNAAEVMKKAYAFGLVAAGGQAGGVINGEDPNRVGRPLTAADVPRQWPAYGGGLDVPFGTSQTEFWDENAVMTHIQDTAYAGGAGYKGDILPPVGSTETVYRPPGWKPWAPAKK